MDLIATKGTPRGLGSPINVASSILEPLTSPLLAAIAELRARVLELLGTTSTNTSILDRSVELVPRIISNFLSDLGLTELLPSSPLPWSLAIGLVTVVLLSMAGWGRRFWSGGGRFSPVGAAPYPTQLTDDDYSYITTDDLEPPPPTIYEPLHRPARPPEDDDRILLRHRSSTFPVYFPPYSIDDGVLKIGQLRSEAAQIMGLPDPRRVQMYYKGRALKDDFRSCRDEQLKIDSEVLCVPEELLEIGPRREDMTDSDRGESTGASADGPTKKKRNRPKKGKGKGGRSPNPSLAPPEPTSSDSRSGQSPPGSTGPKSAREKLEDLSSHFHTKLLPQCVHFSGHPPSDPAKRDFEHRKLSETIMNEFMLKLDAVETEGDPETRQRRKDLVKKAQDVLNGLDAVVKQGR
ncbi:MAG: hypothetical protein M1823_000620 [Watsoniomyces obsoletus]|nr:MAG: hypothetical protein M1823_000620 [Watsoniomyces obsoletus]